MRISDWSSDVCSSDLLTGSERNVLPILGDGFVEQLGLALERFVEGFDSGAFLRCKAQNHRFLFHLHQGCPLELSHPESTALLHMLEIDIRYEIGRASCRERVCKYV